MTAPGKLFKTTAFKLSVLYLAVFTALAAFLILYIARNTNDLLRQEINGAIDAELKGLSEQYRLGGIRRLVDVIGNRSRRPGASLYLVTDFAGNNLTGNIAAISQQVMVVADGTAQPVLYEPLARLADDPAAEGSAQNQALARVFVLPGGFRLLVGRDLGESRHFRAVITDAFRLTAVVVVLLGLISWVFVSRRVLKRIDSVSETTSRIMAGDLSGRLEITGTDDEFDRLAINLNGMLARIEELMQGLKDVSDNIAHDLKTPLTRLRNRVDAALHQDMTQDDYREVLEATIAESDTLIRTFDALLMIARAEARSSGLAMAPIDLAEIARTMGELYEPVAEDAGFEFSVAADAPATVTANRELIGQAIANLIDNAIKYGADGNDRRISIVAEPIEAGGARIIVADTGTGIPEGDRERVRQRFVRLDESRSAPGSGLGLSLVQAVTRLHDGKLILEDNNPGLKVVLELPEAQTGPTANDQQGAKAGDR